MPDELPMRISSIEVKNFKSLVEFKLDLAKFTCLVGLNGVGKSTVLQFIDFLAQLIRGDMKDWLNEREWRSGDLGSRLIAKKKKNINFCVRFVDAAGKPAGRWEAHYSPASNRCSWERFDFFDYVIDATTATVEQYRVSPYAAGGDNHNWKSDVKFSYEGSVLSSLKESLLAESILKCKRFFQGIESLDMLTPERLRQRTRSAAGSLGHGGRNLSAFLYELPRENQMALSKELKLAYPQLQRVYAKSLRSGWKQLEASERFGGRNMSTEARHLNDGLLRLVAIFSEINSKHGFVLFDEIENGINPELVEFVIDALVHAPQQVLVTTHSPLILNYLDDERACEGVIYLYRTSKGFTRSIRLFSIPSLKKKLSVMGPGEAFVDTDLTGLAREIEAVPQGSV